MTRYAIAALLVILVAAFVRVPASDQTLVKQIKQQASPINWIRADELCIETFVELWRRFGNHGGDNGGRQTKDTTKTGG